MRTKMVEPSLNDFGSLAHFLLICPTSNPNLRSLAEEFDHHHCLIRQSRTKMEPYPINSLVEAHKGSWSKERQALIKKYLRRLETDHPKFFGDKPKSVPPIRGEFGEHTIETKPGFIPKKCRPYRQIGEKLDGLNENIKQFRENGWIQECQSEMCHPRLSSPNLTNPGKKQAMANGLRLQYLNSWTLIVVTPSP
jgi:hypothetical protein